MTSDHFDWDGYVQHLRDGGAPFADGYSATIREAVDAYRTVIRLQQRELEELRHLLDDAVGVGK